MLVCFREISTGHLGNALKLQRMEARENCSLGKFVFYDSRTFQDKVTIFCLEYVSYVGTGMLAFPNI
jgi:hypothetical protein